MSENLKITRASKNDSELVFLLTKELMAHHKMLNVFTMSISKLEMLIENDCIKSYIAYNNNEPIGILNFFYMYTTFTGEKILYIEDLYVKEQYRGSGAGKSFLDCVKEIAKENHCEKIELKCAQWNTASGKFYEKIGFIPDKEWITYTLDKSKF
ncbi:MAG: GNAT family N-acetyltransferase [Ruminococcus sp.]|nr:GNAT family N-acetyltransferase [Ruminococcus sp.]CDF01009.1 acetyltransferase GNAT family protein [Ruminococcus sp. CAG:624]